ncbi:unnamed protein product [Mycena citricolor]|uniref:Uncharacterized protein n=1 Tax=Mycena citricolor TaxID=2018698 RepID=A0AAD2HB82_9AGAR|nr:unnamed protein product [Mycena citricolor]
MSQTIVDQEQNVSLLALHPIIELSHPFGPQLCCHPGLSIVAVIKWWVHVCWIDSLEYARLLRFPNEHEIKLLCSNQVACHKSRNAKLVPFGSAHVCGAQCAIWGQRWEETGLIRIPDVLRGVTGELASPCLCLSDRP